MLSLFSPPIPFSQTVIRREGGPPARHLWCFQVDVSGRPLPVSDDCIGLKHHGRSVTPGPGGGVLTASSRNTLTWGAGSHRIVLQEYRS